MNMISKWNQSDIRVWSKWDKSCNSDQSGIQWAPPPPHTSFPTSSRVIGICTHRRPHTYSAEIPKIYYVTVMNLAHACSWARTGGQLFTRHYTSEARFGGEVSGTCPLRHWLNGVACVLMLMQSKCESVCFSCGHVKVRAAAFIAIASVGRVSHLCVVVCKYVCVFVVCCSTCLSAHGILCTHHARAPMHTSSQGHVSHPDPRSERQRPPHKRKSTTQPRLLVRASPPRIS